ncbi:MAG: hypothetical protein H7A48_00665 [Akkermansiaceae bacterium]|nr:hypothetical protein [Akkermansiaceae bacterium]
MNDLRQVGLALSDFDYEYGSFPNDSTIAVLKAGFPGDPTPLGRRSSNDYFRQLFVSGIAWDEKSFHAGFSPKPDGFTGSRALEAGECSFAYVRNVAVLDPDTPLVVFPLVKGSLKADTKLCAKWGNKAAVLFVDNRVITLPVDSSGQVIFKGRDLFDPAQPFWHGTSPDVVWPE